jgi:hypothetical protein
MYSDQLARQLELRTEQQNEARQALDAAVQLVTGYDITPPPEPEPVDLVKADG